MHKSLCLSLLALSPPGTGLAREGDPDALTKALFNPVAALISVPFQYNYDETFGDDGHRHTLNIQPVIPASMSEGCRLARSLKPSRISACFACPLRLAAQEVP